MGNDLHTVCKTFHSSLATLSYTHSKKAWCEVRSLLPGPRLKAFKADNAGLQRDAWSNTPSSILSRADRRLYLQESHPLGILRTLIEDHFGPSYSLLRKLNPIVTVQQNFDDLGFPTDHPGRSRSDTYYLNRENVLRTHTSAHEVEAFAAGHDKWLLAADVYRRDEIDASHHPVFHQMEGACVLNVNRVHEMFDAQSAELERRVFAADIFVDDQTTLVTPLNPFQDEHDQVLGESMRRNLKANLNALALHLFGGHGPLEIRWIDAYFPFTSPSYEVEVKFGGKWLEVLGCGIVAQRTLMSAGVPNKVGWAFGLGLERLAMVLFSIPDIRLFWSEDLRFHRQFQRGKVSTFLPYSRFPPVGRDISFWLPSKSWCANDFYEIVREVLGDLIENTKLVDDFKHPQSGRRSLCYHLVYRSFDRNLTDEEVNCHHKRLSVALENRLGIKIR